MLKSLIKSLTNNPSFFSKGGLFVLAFILGWYLNQLTHESNSLKAENKQLKEISEQLNSSNIREAELRKAYEEILKEVESNNEQNCKKPTTSCLSDGVNSLFD